MNFNPIMRDEVCYCGPGAVCIITGWPATVVNQAFRLNRDLVGQRPINTAHGPYPDQTTDTWIRGTNPLEVQEVLEVFGYRMRGAKDDSATNVMRRMIRHGRRPSHPKPTFRGWLNWRLHPERMYLVIVSNHWMLVQGDQWQDVMYETPRPVQRLHLSRGRVRAVYRITAPAGWSRPVWREGRWVATRGGRVVLT